MTAYGDLMPNASLIQAIARMEGFYAHGPNPNRPQRNNNPGNLNFGDFAKENGAAGGDPRYAIFPDASTGFAALRSLLGQHYIGMTVESAINKYAPPVENNTTNYVDLVCKWTGLTPGTIVSAENIG